MKKRTLFAIITLSIAFIMFIVLGIQAVSKTQELVNLANGNI
jgi:hypothetical protein